MCSSGKLQWLRASVVNARSALAQGLLGHDNSIKPSHCIQCSPAAQTESWHECLFQDPSLLWGAVQVITQLDEHGHKLEPYEEAVVEVPEAHMGGVVDLMGSRKGQMQDMSASAESLKPRHLPDPHARPAGAQERHPHSDKGVPQCRYVPSQRCFSVSLPCCTLFSHAAGITCSGHRYWIGSRDC